MPDLFFSRSESATMRLPTSSIFLHCAIWCSVLMLSACGGGDAQPPVIAAAPAPVATVPPVAPPVVPPVVSPPASSPTPTPTPTGTVITNFDETTPPAVVEFGGAGYAIEAGPAGGSGKALKITRPGGEVFAGAFVTTPPIAFSATRRTITARVYSPAAGTPFVVKAEYADNAGTADTLPTTAVVVGWQTLTWTFNGLDLAKSYTRFTVLPNLGTVGTGQSYYIDDITLAPETAAPPPVATDVDFIIANFDGAAQPPIVEFGGAGYAIEAGPAGGAGNALRITRPGGEVFAGAFVSSAAIPFSANRKTITARVYSPTAGVPMVVKAEFGDNAGTPDTLPTAPVVVGWQTLTWVFNTLDLSKSYTRFTLLPNLGTVGSGQSYYFDDIKLLPATAPVVTPPAVPLTVATLDEPGAALQGFEGCFDSTLVADPAGGTNKVGRVVKPGSGVPFYCGTTVITVANGGFQAIPFTATATTMTVRVWSPDVGIPVRLKVEDIADGAKSVETEATTSVVGWQTLRFDFANAAAGTPVLNLSTRYNKATIFFDFGRVGSGKSYYFDDLTFVTGTGTDLVLVTFDERNFDNTQSQPSVLLGFGGAENSSLVGASDGLPADGSKAGKSAKVVKNAGETFAGTSMQRKPNDAVPTIPFTTAATRMSVRVYSAYPGMRVHLKVEQSGRPDFNSEVDAFTSLANTWETLIFEFGPAGKHFVPSGPGPNGYITDPNSPAYRPTSQLDVSKTFNKVNIFFDYGLGDAGYDAMPGTRTYYFDDVKFVP
jgi:hypothetical protein